MGRSVRDRSSLFWLLPLAALSLLLSVACWAAAKLRPDATLVLIGLFSAFAIAGCMDFRPKRRFRALRFAAFSHTGRNWALFLATRSSIVGTSWPTLPPG